MNRKERRALAHKERKLARKLGFPPVAQESPSVEPIDSAALTGKPAAAQPSLNPQTLLDKLTGIPEPGGLFPPLSAITPTLAAAARPTSASSSSAVSDAQLAANRANSLKSSGPKTEAGLAISSQNRTTHGLARHNGTFRILTTEDPAKFAALKTALEAEHQPQSETEAILVNAMAESHWLSKRAEKLVDTTSDPNTGQVTDPKMFTLYMRYATTHTRAFHKSLNDLLKLRKETRTAENGFEAQKRIAAELTLKLEKHEMKKQGHYWDILRKDAEACGRIKETMLQKAEARKQNPNFDAEWEAELAKNGLRPSFMTSSAVAA